jgi:hypothetical protein
MIPGSSSNYFVSAIGRATESAIDIVGIRCIPVPDPFIDVATHIEDSNELGFLLATGFDLPPELEFDQPTSSALSDPLNL